jgi:sporulation protein YlmC with PRC-barrel domain
MKKTVLRALALCLTTVLVSGYALAQDNYDSTKSGRSRSTSTGTPGSSIGAFGANSTTGSQMGKSVRLSKVMNQSINGQSGESLGQVQDFIVDPATGQIQFVILSVNGTSSGAPGSSSAASTGIGSSSSSTSRGSSTSGIGSTSSAGGNLVAVPWSLAQAGSSSDQFSLNVDRSKLQSAPTFTSSSWPTMDSSWSQQVYSHFGVSGTSNTGAPGSSSGTSTSPSGINQSTPGLPSTPGTPDIAPPPSSGTGTGTGTPGSTGTGTGTGTSGTGSPGSAGGK